jgi:hypothetical protein
MLAAFDRMTLPGLVVRSTFVGTPVWKAACVVSVRQALASAGVRGKFRVVVALSFTTMFVNVPEV